MIIKAIIIFIIVLTSSFFGCALFPNCFLFIISVFIFIFYFMHDFFFSQLTLSFHIIPGH